MQLGGLDLDAAFMAALLPRLPDTSNWSEADRDQFRLNLELAKVRLSTHASAPVELPTGGCAEITRAQFGSAVRPLIHSTQEPVEPCLRDSPGRIDHLVMVGGSSRIPAVQQFTADIVGPDPSTGVDPMTAIAQGAAIAAGILRGIITDLDFYGAPNTLSAPSPHVGDSGAGESRYSSGGTRSTPRAQPTRTRQSWTSRSG